MEYKIGLGYDIHRLTSGRKLFLGGLEIPYVKGLLGHSDADVLLHALCDALLGALGLGDIGEHFPDTDARYQGISSVKLLEQVNIKVKEMGFEIGNLDIVVIAQEPPLLPFKKQIKKNIAGYLGILESSVNIKAKTNEGLDSTGSKEAIACWAVVMLTRSK
ncbi:MAG: 2-C-methyl-D-erythritol 2,4-cyclodiphosphate synthase [Candidatus Omnitrophica bacterium]|jgi:2-C-methyl-D-erythritol 2,4-cyclodiphosphate synthase|nr:2-C-methyl-D-erythritol 2,4-cyclodiphosphate synthase [Candidatus Omnitrophota bacterium]